MSHPESAGTVLLLRHDSIRPDPDQPRKEFDEAALQELAQSLDSEGLLQPISVRPDGDGDGYILIAGERRWRAAGILEWETIPALVHESLTDQEAARLQLLENIVRRDLNPIEEAQALRRMLDEGYTIEELANALGRPANQITWRVEMLEAPEPLLLLVANGTIVPSVAHSVSRLSPAGQQQAMQVVTKPGLTYDQVIAVCEQIQANENQVTIFDELMMSDESRAVVTDFEAGFRTIGRALKRLEKAESEKPGLLAHALATRSGSVEAELTETIKGLSRIRRALKDVRARQMVQEVA